MSATATEVFDRIPHDKLDVSTSTGTQSGKDGLFSSKGRIGVWRYNAIVAQSLLVMFAGGVAGWLGVSTDSGLVMALTLVPAVLLIFAAFAVMIHAAVKRLHDIGRSGWFYLISCIPVIGIVWSLYYALKPGNEEDNQFGAPLEATSKDKLFGVLGIFLLFSLSLLSLIPME